MPERIILPGDPRIHFVGRFNHENPLASRFAWTGSSIRFRFRGTDFGVHLTHEADEYRENYYAVIIDGQQHSIIRATPADNFFQVASGLSDGMHNVTLFRRTEAMCGVATFRGISFTRGNQILDPPKPPQRRIAFIGNSITCGFGNAAASETDDFSPATEDGYRAYSAICARDLEAEYHAICFSGRGVFQNYDLSTAGTLPALFPLVYPQSDQEWDFSRWVADVVVINLGSNDFAQAMPGKKAFVNAYTSLIKAVKKAYPRACIVCLDGPILEGEKLKLCQQYILTALGRATSAGMTNMMPLSLTPQRPSDYGAQGHPNLAQHRRNADELTEFIRKTLNW